MNKVYVFNRTTRGHLHIMREIPCEDFSTSFSSEDGRYHIVVVADGHGSDACFRSSIGSKIVSEVALNCLNEFAKACLESEESEERFYRDIFSNPRYRKMTIKQLTDTIVANWHDRVLEDYSNNPPTEEELGEYAEKYKDGNRFEHIYGTTVIAALLLPSCLLLIHQGDGRCDVFYEDGTIDQPIPWDDRCQDTSTTSMCDTDVAESFRHSVLNPNTVHDGIIAVYLGSDGVEDAYRDTYDDLGGSHSIMGGVHTFYKYISCKVSEYQNKESFYGYLDEFLPEFSADGLFSRAGSGDDVSIAGIVDLDSISNFVESYKKDTQRYSLDEQLFWKEDELRSKTRKHGILKKRMDEAEQQLQDKERQIQLIDNELSQLNAKREGLWQALEKVNDEINQYSQEVNAVAGDTQVQELKSAVKTFFQSFLDSSASERTALERKKNRITSELNQIDGQIIDLQNKKIATQNELSVQKNAYHDAKEKFDEYDAKYQSIDAERREILDEINNLS
ncbi:MAG: protein phosphatase 2C domain-containing protein [Ruminococcus sp.]|nr:protein phosphatase 2C domain-containing protein [Ruminococcus sp.]